MADKKEKENLKNKGKAEENAENTQNAEKTENAQNIENAELKNNEPTAEPEKNELEKAKEENAALNDKYLRLCAEYDNFKKRTVREKEAIYIDAAADAIKELLPVMDNLARAMDSISDKDNDVYKGIEMVYKQTEDIFKKLGVCETKAVGEEFNPELHNAVMHIEDENVTENTVVEEFQKGYTYKDKVLRYSMVKVAN